MGVMQRCFARLTADCDRVECTMKLDYRKGYAGELKSRVARIEQSLSRSVKTEDKTTTSTESAAPWSKGAIVGKRGYLDTRLESAKVTGVAIWGCSQGLNAKDSLEN